MTTHYAYGTTVCFNCGLLGTLNSQTASKLYHSDACGMQQTVANSAGLLGAKSCSTGYKSTGPMDAEHHSIERSTSLLQHQETKINKSTTPSTGYAAGGTQAGMLGSRACFHHTECTRTVRYISSHLMRTIMLMVCTSTDLATGCSCTCFQSWPRHIA